MPYHLLVTFWIVSTLVLWWKLDRQLARRRAHGLTFVLVSLLRTALVIFVVWVLFFPSVILINLALAIDLDSVPLWLVLSGYLWCIAVLSPLLAVVLPVWSWRACRRFIRWIGQRRAAKNATEPTTGKQPAETEPTWSRRDALWLTAALLPPSVSTAMTALSAAQLGSFRIREQTLKIKALPSDLDGLSIAHISDLHVGNFLPNETLDLIAAAVDSLKPELVVFTGDLIDRGLLYRIKPGFRLLDHIIRRKRYPFAMIEGNHDVLGNATEFEEIVQKATEDRLLLDSQMLLYPRGKYLPPVQALGITWGRLTTPAEFTDFDVDPTRPIRFYSDALTADRVNTVAAMRKPGAFPLLLAHHPHAFDAAAAANLPLTLAGHSHGGQIMLTPDLGVGSVRFKYWAGTHTRGDSQMSISNGIGVWFPLRINAPAEIVHLTLRTA